MLSQHIKIRPRDMVLGPSRPKFMHMLRFMGYFYWCHRTQSVCEGKQPQKFLCSWQPDQTPNGKRQDLGLCLPLFQTFTIWLNVYVDICYFFCVYLFDGLEFLETYTQISWHRVFPFSCSFANMSEVCFEAIVGPEQHYGEYKNYTSTKHP